LQPSGTAPNSILAESLLSDEELDETFDVRGFPFKVAVCMVGRSNVRVEEELAGIGVRPVFRDLEFGLSCFDSFDEFLEGVVFAD
jgi:hypothetical protein